MKDKIGAFLDEESNVIQEENFDTVQVTIEALRALGYKRHEAIKAVSQIEHTGSVEEMISLSLRKIL